MARSAKEQLEYYYKNREHINDLRRLRHKEHPERKKAWDRTYHQIHRKEQNERQARWRLKLRKEAILRYGGKCFCCGEDKLEFLAVHHVNGHGREHRKQVGKATSSTFYRWLIKEKRPDISVLCHNCNSSIGFYGYCPHKERR